MTAGSDFGAGLGMRIAMIGSKVRETSLANTTPALVRVASQVADTLATQRAEAARVTLVDWLSRHGVTAPADGELTGLLGGLTKGLGWLAQAVVGQAIGFGTGMALSSVLAPYFNDLTQAAWRSNPSQLLSPAELALAVLRGHMEAGPATAEALSNGLTAERFQTLLDNTGEPPGVDAVLGLWRRGVVDDATLEKAVRQSRLRPEWLDTIRALGVQWPSWAEFLDAYLEGQVDEATARDLYARAGGDPELFDLLFDTRGQAPTPSQALDLLNRGIIAERGSGPTETSYEQAFLEGPWRNKWLEPFLALREYVVPPRSVRPMVAAGAWTVERGMEELGKSGVPEETARAILEEAAAGKLATERDLVKSEVIAAYRDGIDTAEVATANLEALGYSSDEADLLLALADHAYEQSLRTALVSRLRTLYTGYKITEEETSSSLAALGVGGTAASKYLALWDVLRTTPQADLTESQVRNAALKGVVDQAYYEGWLADHGYSPDEVQILTGLYMSGGA